MRHSTKRKSSACSIDDDKHMKKSEGHGDQDVACPTRKDLKLLARIAVFGLLAGLVPQDRWRSALGLLAKLWTPAKRRRVLEKIAREVDIFETALGAAAPGSRLAKATNVIFTHQEDMLAVLKDGLPGGWQPKLAVRGTEHLAAALQRGRGAVLWVALQRYRLAWKMALHRAGIHVAHLSRPEHGFSSTAFGIRWLNPLCTRVESRYVERVVIDSGGEIAALRGLRQKLRRNEIVSIQDSGSSGRTIEVPFLAGYWSFFIGAPSIALASGAALLPLFPLREDDATFVAEIGPEIRAPEGASRDAAIAAMTREFARGLAEHARARPEHWSWGRWSPMTIVGAGTEARS
jgi:lauroyl/myristoyl acyltransferase